MPGHHSGGCRPGGVKRVNRRYRDLFFHREGERRWGKRGYPCARFERSCGSRPMASAIDRSPRDWQCALHRAGVRSPRPRSGPDLAAARRDRRSGAARAALPARGAAVAHAAAGLCPSARELRRRGVTRLLLWEEYKAAHPDGWQYSVFCDQYRRWLARQELVLRQDTCPGRQALRRLRRPDGADHRSAHRREPRGADLRRRARLFQLHACRGDAGRKAPATGWARTCARWSPSAACRARSCRTTSRAACSKAHRYEPEINPAYQDFAEHYAVAILPARVRKPRDKAKVEAGVLVVERWILARLRNQHVLLARRAQRRDP